jgi:hypothetical protein
MSIGTVSRGDPHIACTHAGYELICLAVKRKFVQRLETNRHEGQITSDFPKSCQAQESKIFCFRSHPNQSHNSTRLTADEGRFAIVTNAR